MPLTSVLGEDDIVTKLKTIQGVDVMQGQFTSNGYVPTTDANKLFAPYLLVSFNPGFPVHDNGLTGPDKDSIRATFSVYIISPDDRTSRLFRDKVKIALLTSFSPTDGSSLAITGGYDLVDGGLGFNRFIQVISFFYTTNLS